MKRYKQGDQSVFNQDMEEYKNLEEFASMLNENSPNKHKYVVKDVYFDMGQDWKWTSIIDETAACVVLSPRMWFDIVNRDVPYSDLIKEFFNDEYCQDKKE